MSSQTELTRQTLTRIVMLSSMNSLSDARALSLFRPSNVSASSNTHQPSTAQDLLQDFTGNTDDRFQAEKSDKKDYRSRCRDE